MSEKTSHDLNARLAVFRYRLRLRDGWLLFQRISWIAALLVVTILVTGRMVPIPQLGVWAFVPPLFILCASLGYSLLKPVSLMIAARQVDLALGLKERLSTALEFGEQVEDASPAILVRRQMADARKIAASIDSRKVFPLKWLRQPTLAATGILVVALVLAWLPNPMDAVLAERAAVAQVAREQAERIESHQQVIEQSATLTPELQAELLRQLGELAEKLRQNSGDREKALADISQLEASLHRQVDPNADQSQVSLQAIEAQLQTLAKMEDIDEGDPTLSAEALNKMAEELDKMDLAQQASLSGSLSELAAQAAQAGDTTLSQALASLSQATRVGDSTAAAQASSQVLGALDQARQLANDQNALQQAMGHLKNASQAISSAGLPNQSILSNQMGSQSGNNQGQGQSGQGMSGGGTKANQLPPGTGAGQARPPRNQDTGSQTGDPADALFVPWERRSDQGAELTIPGQDTDQGETLTRENPNPLAGLPGTALIPYQQFFSQYQQAAQQAMDRIDIPPAYKDLVRDYFTLLEP